MHTFKKIIHFKLTLLILLLLPFVVFTLITSNTNLLPNLKSFVVMSGSMTPLIPTGSMTYSIKQKTYTDGDIIAFKNNAGQTVTHRIVQVIHTNGQTTYLTKGDANNAADADKTSQQKVFGRVYIFFPYLGTIVVFLKSPLGFILGIVVPSFIFIGLELWNIKKEIVTQTEKRILNRIGNV